MSEKTKPKLNKETAEAIAEAFTVELLREILAELRAIRERIDNVTSAEGHVMTVDKYR